MRLIAAVLLTVASIAAEAGPQPSFGLRHGLRGCASNAEHVVRVYRADGAGDWFVVVESWRGGFEPGDLIRFPGLPAPETSRGWLGERMTIRGTDLVLFLEGDRDQLVGAHDRGPRRARDRVSAVWVELTGLHAYQQWESPGPVRLHPLDQTLRELRREVAATP